MNVLIVNAGRGWGGIESHSVVLASDLAGRGHKVIVACTPGGNVRANLDAALPVADLEVVNAGDLPAICRLAGIIRREGIEVVLANSGKEYWPAAVAAALLGKKIVFVRHQTDRIRTTTRLLINSRIDRVVAVSGAVRKALLGSGIDEEKITVIHNGVSLDRFDPSRIDRAAVRRELGIGADDIVIGTVGKLHEGKGVYELLRAGAGIAEGTPLTLLFVGDGPEKEGIRREADRLGLAERVVITGIRRDVERMYAAMDVFVLASTCDEAFGMVIIEAMAMAKPVVATLVGGIPELICPGENGLLVPPADAAALRSALVSLLGNAEYAGRIARAGRKTAEDTFSEAALGRGFERLLASL
ncbi:MAG: glycosyltransferase family 4 protein [Nitrospiraceae bacterium]|nr:glycosyltransferase family 4 protein [Nitrospiraceae bacterium]